MEKIIDSIFLFAARVLAVPELAAILPALFAGLAMTYLVQRLLPWDMRVRNAELIGRVAIFVAVMTVALMLHFSPTTFAWAFMVAIMSPQFYEWGTEIVYHRWPWLKPKALQTMVEQCRVPESPP